MAKVANMSSTIDLGRKYRWIISNANMNETKKSRPTGIEKY